MVSAHRDGGRGLCPPESELKRAHPWVLVATAHPAKFNEVVEPVIGRTVDVPESLARLLSLPRHFLDLAPNLQALAAAIG